MYLKYLIIILILKLGREKGSLVMVCTDKRNERCESLTLLHP